MLQSDKRSQSGRKPEMGRRPVEGRGVREGGISSKKDDISSAWLGNLLSGGGLSMPGADAAMLARRIGNSAMLEIMTLRHGMPLFSDYFFSGGFPAASAEAPAEGGLPSASPEEFTAGRLPAASSDDSLDGMLSADSSPRGDWMTGLTDVPGGEDGAPLFVPEPTFMETG